MFSNFINGYLIKLVLTLRLASYPVSLSEHVHLCLLPPAAVKPVKLPWNDSFSWLPVKIFTFWWLVYQTVSALSNMSILHLVP